MKLLRLKATNYRCLRDVSIELEDFNLFIGANASGKSTILDALRFLHEGVHARDFEAPMFSRGGMLNLAWKGEEAHQINLAVTVQDGKEATEWSIRITRQGHYFHVGERVAQVPFQSPPVVLLEADRGTGWWWSNTTSERVQMQQPATVCALAAAAADASFPAREIADFVRRWGFFDPNPFLLRRDWSGLDSSRLDHYGRNLGETLHALASSAPEVVDRIRSATQEHRRSSGGHRNARVGRPVLFRAVGAWSPICCPSDGSVQWDIAYTGTDDGAPRRAGDELAGESRSRRTTSIRALCLPSSSIFGNPQDRVQFMVTTHSPLLLDLLDDPGSVCVVQRSDGEGTAAWREANPNGVRDALNASGFSLGEFYQTKGFGAP